MRKKFIEPVYMSLACAFSSVCKYKYRLLWTFLSHIRKRAGVNIETNDG